LIHFARRILETPFLLLIIALVCFLVSVIIDTFFEFSGFMTFVEDVSKSTGIVSWLANRDMVIMDCSKPSSCYGNELTYGEPAGEMGVQRKEKCCALRSSAGATAVHRIRPHIRTRQSKGRVVNYQDESRQLYDVLQLLTQRETSESIERQILNTFGGSSILAHGLRTP